MRRYLFVLVASCGVANGLSGGVPALADEAVTYEAGLAKVDITPTADEPVRLSGYGNRDKPYEGIDTKLWARALALKAGDGRVHVLLSVDTIGFPGALTTNIARRLEKEHGISRERFVQCSTHSHTAPNLDNGLTNLFAVPLSPREEEASKRYTARITELILDCIGRAIRDMKPARLATAEGKVGFAVNRRVLDGGRWKGFGVNRAGPVDHSLPVLRITSPEGKLRGIVFNYACHCTTLGGNYNRVGGDWAGFAAADLEERHPGIVALCTIGCGADANPEPRGKLEMARAHGRALALEVERLLAGGWQEITAEPVASFGYAGLPVDRPSLEELRAALKSTRPQVRRHAENMLALHRKMGRLPETYPMPIQTWQFGKQLTMVFLGGEVVVDYALRLKKELESRQLWITAYANDVFAYVASERVRKEGGYEVDFSMIYYNQPGPWAEGTEEVVIRRVHEILDNPQGEGALSPDQALGTFHLPEGLAIEAVATEPLITDPVNFAFGPDGRLWVVEMRDYPRGLDDAGRPGGRVVVLSDTDGDGVFDRSSIFLDNLAYPTGVMPWRNGALVSCAPDIFFAEDTDGDGTADRRQVLFTGFVLSNPQHRINGFAWGLDNWVYLASGASSGRIRALLTGEEINVSGRDMRIQPDTGVLDPVSGRAQYGRHRDDWGNWFGNNNSRPLWHYVISDRYLRRNPYVVAPVPRVELLTPNVAPPVYPKSRTVDRFNDLFAANRFTSACSPNIFRDATLGPDVEGAAFICEPVHNLVHRAMLVPDGVTFRAERHPSEQRSEFLASTDVWFRPTYVATGPDGALWVADMYRLVIEHPEWIPLDWQQRLNLRAGEERGRIYRIYRKGHRPGPLPRLDQLSVEQLVHQLESTNGTVRDLAQQRLVERGTKEAVPLLERLVAKASRPQTRLQALCTLGGLNALEPDVLLQALEDKNPHVRRWAVRWSEALLSSEPQLAQAVLGCADDPEPVVRLQVALSLGEWRDPQAAEALARLALNDRDDPWIRAAVLSSAVPHAERMLASVLARPTEEVPAPLLEALIATVVGSDRKQGASRILAAVLERQDDSNDVWRMQALAASAEALARRNIAAGSLRGQASDEVRAALDKLLEAARRLAGDTRASVEARVAAVRLLGSGLGTDAESDTRLLVELLAPQTPVEVQAASVAALATLRRDEAPALLLRDWKRRSPRLRAEILSRLLTRPQWIDALLDALAEEKLSAGDFDAAARSRLLQHPQERVRRRAAQLLNTAGSPSREAVVAKYAAALTSAGNPLRGELLFARHCTTCHRYRGEGKELGPNLAELQDRSPQALLVSMLDPNRAVESKYLAYAAVTVDGRVLNGLVQSESTTSITLWDSNGRREDVLREDLEEFASTGKSFMPEGLEKDLSVQDVADVIAYLGHQPQPLGEVSDEAAARNRTLLHDAGLETPIELLGGAETSSRPTCFGDCEISFCSGRGRAGGLRWRAEPAAVPAGTKTQPLRAFFFPIVMKAADAAAGATLELQVGESTSLTISPVSQDASWISADGRVRARYLVLAVDSRTGETSGLLRIAVASDGTGGKASRTTPVLFTLSSGRESQEPAEGFVGLVRLP